MIRWDGAPATSRRSAPPRGPWRPHDSSRAATPTSSSQGDDRELLVTDADRRRVWTSRVWPGGVLVEGEIVGTWRRAHETVTIQTWRRLSRAARDAVEAEARALPLPGVRGAIAVRWDD